MRSMKHSYVMAALVLVLVASPLFFSGLAGGSVFLLWPLACVGMVVALMWGIRSMGGPARHTRPDGVTHSHDEDLTRPGR